MSVPEDKVPLPPESTVPLPTGPPPTSSLPDPGSLAAHPLPTAGPLPAAGSRRPADDETVVMPLRQRSPVSGAGVGAASGGAGPGRPATPSFNAETMVLPAFLTGRKASEPKPAEPARHQAEGALPRNERGMLIFVAALLGLGTIAVVVMLGLGSLTSSSGHAPPVVSGSTFAEPFASLMASPAATGVGPTLSATPSLEPSPSRTPATHRASPKPSLLGVADLDGYCDKHGGGRPVYGRGGWHCRGDDFGTTVTAAKVCDWQFGRASHAVVGKASDPRTWRCYR